MEHDGMCAYWELIFREFDEADEFCPYCDNHFVLPAVTADAMLGLEEGSLRAAQKLGALTTNPHTAGTTAQFMDFRMSK